MPLTAQLGTLMGQLPKGFQSTANRLQAAPRDCILLWLGGSKALKMHDLQMPADQDRAYTARRMIRVRDARNESYPRDMFDEHAWNMLLHLFVAHCEQYPVTENDIISLSGASLAQGRSWLHRLLDDNQIAKRNDGENVEFTAASLEQMRAFLDKTEIILRSELASLT